MKKILFVLLALTFMLTLLVACGSAEHDPMSGEKPSKYSKGLDYEINGKYCTITGIGSCKDTEIYIPEEIEGKKVTTIGAKAFEDNTMVTKIWLPDTITKIERRAFMNCSNLKVINIPKSAGTIEAQIFDGCDQLEEFYYYYIPSSKYDKDEFQMPKAKKIVFGGQTLGSRFENNDVVEEIVLFDSVTTIPSKAFQGCTSLTSITIPDSVTSIGGLAFKGCSNLKSIFIPDSVTSITSSAFDGCESMSIEIDKNNSRYTIEGNCLISISEDGNKSLEKAFLVCDIPNDLFGIYEGAFKNLENIKITIPDSVRWISFNAFVNCKNIEVIVGASYSLLADNFSVQYGDQSRFLGCENVSLTITNTAGNIAEEAFEYSDFFTTVKISDGITSIGDDAFSGCSKLTTVIIPDSVTSIGVGTFSGCDSLKDIVTTNGVTKIVDSMYGGCENLVLIRIPNGITSIGNFAFSYCSGLSSITIPNSVTKIGSYAFSNCSNLLYINFKGTMAEWNQVVKDKNWNGENWKGRIPATVVHCTDGDVPIQ